MIRKIPFVLGVMLMTAAALAGEKFVLRSSNLRDGDRMDTAQVYNGFGYAGKNLSPALRWSGAPEGTQSYAVTMFDPDAPHPGGWWHWFVIDIPASVNGLPEGAKPGNGLPDGAVQIETDFGNRDYGGPAPPPGKAHRYIFTVYALRTAKLPVSHDVKPVDVKAMLEKNALAKAALTGHFGRPK
jgi:Raf kinase inhibitor-like YbhB/YbcL family protein